MPIGRIRNPRPRIGCSTVNAETSAAARLQVYLLSGGSGRTCQHVLRAALAQFGDPPVDVHRFFQLTSSEAVEAVLADAVADQALVIHTFVDPAIRQTVDQVTRHHGLVVVDPLGPVISALGDRLGMEPAGRPGLLYELAREQFDRLDAVDFTLAHDDGQRLFDLDQADVVLVGVSRVSKSVTCFYLAMRGFRAANVPFTPGMSVPPELEQLPAERVIGLTITPARLAAIRQQRLQRLTQREVPDYADIRSVAREIREAEREYHRRGWRCIDVSYKATEEVAAEIITYLTQQAGTDTNHDQRRQ
ncbi:MAG: kinase/pyrophosphorylase [Planctomycetota bacterium]|nr:MAG: kinase/pyrophosphorylase [Planctomycetota bacterium]